MHAQPNTKFIQKIAFEGNLGYSNLNTTTTPNAVLDFMNYCRAKDLEDPSYLTIASHVWLKNTMQVDVEIGMDGYVFDFNLYYDLKVTSPLYKFVNYNLGFNKRFLLLTGIESYYGDTFYPYYLRTNQHQRYSPQELYGPYAGLNYHFDQKRWAIRADLNVGVLYNSKKTIDFLVKELSSNFIKLDQYKIHSTPSLWISSELYLAYALVDTKKMQLGCRIKGEYFVTKKGLNYALTENSWTGSNPIITQKVLPKHTISSFNADFGIYVLLK